MSINVPQQIQAGFSLVPDINMRDIKIKIFIVANLVYTEVLDLVEDYEVDLFDAFNIVFNSGKLDQICIVVFESITEEDTLNEEGERDDEIIEELRMIKEASDEKRLMFEEHLLTHPLEEVENTFLFLFQDWSVKLFDYSECLNMTNGEEYIPTNPWAEKIRNTFVSTFLNPQS